MCNSSLLAVLARTAAYTGQEITWKQMVESKMDLSPPAYDMNLNNLPTLPVPVPGQVKFV